MLGDRCFRGPLAASARRVIKDGKWRVFLLSLLLSLLPSLSLPFFHNAGYRESQEAIELPLAPHLPSPFLLADQERATGTNFHK